MQHVLYEYIQFLISEFFVLQTMDEPDPAIVDLPKESNDIGSDAMIVEETENSSSFTQSKEVIVIFFSTRVPIWQFLKFIMTMLQFRR
jgi:hypothetical protein